jgi:hypothetical protein
MKKNVYILTAALATLSLASCERNTGTNPTTVSTEYHQSYTVVYDKEKKTTEAIAMFRTNNASGAIHTLVGNESLNINRNLVDISADRKYYSSNKLTNVEFVLTKNAGEQFLNTVRIQDTSDAQFPSVFPSSINKNTGMVVSWDGKPVDATTEELVLIVDDGVHAAVPRYYQNGQFIFTSGDLINLTPGEVTIKLERFKTMPLQAADDSVSGGERVVMVRTSRKITLL